MRILKAKEKKERALGTRLGLKAHRSDSPKSAMVRRPNKPGMHGAQRGRAPSEYKMQLMEKQKVRLSYGLTEKQMRSVVRNALSSDVSTTQGIMEQLETRLDNVVYRLGLAPSRIVARQLVSHGHVLMNGRKVTIPSCKVRKGDEISIKEKSKSIPMFADLAAILKSKDTGEWLLVDGGALKGTVKSLPENVEMPFDINLVIDYYSR